MYIVYFPDGSAVMSLPTNVEDMSLMPGWRRSPGEGNGNLFQYSCLGNITDREAWWATVLGVTKELSVKSATKQQQKQ